MQRLTDNKIVLVTRPPRLAELVIRYNTVSQARFYLEHQGADFSDYLREDETYHRALREAQAVLAHRHGQPPSWLQSEPAGAAARAEMLLVCSQGD